MKRVLLSLGVFANLLAAPAETVTQQEELPIVAASDLPKSVLEIQIQPPAFDIPHKNPYLAVGLSSLFPGLGHIYLEDHKTAQGLMGSFSLESYLAFREESSPSVRGSSFTLLLNTWFYGIYASYRDVRTYNGNQGYQYKMPSESLADLAYAPFSFATMKKPEVWGALLIELVGAIAVTNLWDLVDEEPTQSIDMPAMIALPIAIGEESFFRGYLQPVYSEWFGPTGGLVASSLLFGAAHIGNAQGMAREDRWKYYAFSIPFITLSGFYDGYLAEKNHSIKETVALHAWYDFTLFAGSYLLANRKAMTMPQSFAVSIPF